MKKELVTLEKDIASKIYMVRDQKVLLDRDLALLYGVETKYLKRQVRRNIERFPGDFMFQLNEDEFQNWRSQIGTSNFKDKMGLRYAPFCFTEQGVAMLSSVLNAKKAIAVNIQIIRVFTKMREILAQHQNLQLELEKVKRQTSNNTSNIELVFTYLDELVAKQSSKKPITKIGYKK